MIEFEYRHNSTRDLVLKNILPITRFALFAHFVEHMTNIFHSCQVRRNFTVLLSRLFDVISQAMDGARMPWRWPIERDNNKKAQHAPCK